MATQPPPTRASKRFADDLRKLLQVSSSDAHELKRALHRGALGSGAEAVAMSSGLLEDAAVLSAQLPQLALVADQIPSTADMLRAARARIRAVDAVLDRFEQKLEDVYGIAPVVLPPLEEEGTSSVSGGAAGFENPALRDVTANVESDRNGCLTRETEVQTAKDGFVPSTPVASRRAVVDAPMPSTPRLEDFGISNEFLEEMSAPPLQFHRSSRKPAVGASHLDVHLTPAPARHSGQSLHHAFVQEGTFDDDGDDETVDEMVQKSMVALGIETPIQVAERFALRQQQSTAAAIAAATPVIARTESSVSVASALRQAPPTMLQHNRALDFETTPRVRSGGLRRSTVLEKRVEDGYKKLPAYLLQKVDCAVLQDAANAIETAGAGRAYTSAELTDLLTNAVPGGQCSFIILSLTKVKVLSLEKIPGAPVIYMLAP